jgi:hypothetical protein
LAHGLFVQVGIQQVELGQHVISSFRLVNEIFLFVQEADYLVLNGTYGQLEQRERAQYENIFDQNGQALTLREIVSESKEGSVKLPKYIESKASSSSLVESYA